MSVEHTIVEWVGYALLGTLGVMCLLIASATTFCLFRSNKR